MENCNRIKFRTEKIAVGEDKGRQTWKEYFKDLYNVDTEEQITVSMCEPEGARKVNYFGEQSMRKFEAEARMKRL